MANVTIIYGSSTGATENIARKLAEAFDGSSVMDAAQLNEAAVASFKDADLVLFGGSTWGYGDLQDDWHAKMGLFEGADFAGVKVGVFGTGDQESYPDTFVDTIGILAEAAEKAGATIVGKTSQDGYTFDESRAARDGELLGLAIDEENQGDMTDDRVAAWVSQLSSEI